MHPVVWAESMSEAVKSLFSAISPTYDRLNHLLSFNIDKSWRKKSIALIKAGPDTELSCLDLCAGTYDLSLACLKRFPRAQITAADFSEGMLQAGMKKIARYTQTGQIKPVCADALHLPFADQSFDVVFCGYGMRNLDDTNRGIQEIKRVLKPGGQVVILEFFKPSDFLGKAFNATYSQVLIPVLGRVISGHAGAYRYLRDSIRGFLTLKQFCDLFEANGFSSIQTRNFMMSVSTAVSAVKS